MSAEASGRAPSRQDKIEQAVRDGFDDQYLDLPLLSDTFEKPCGCYVRRRDDGGLTRNWCLSHAFD